MMFVELLNCLIARRERRAYATRMQSHFFYTTDLFDMAQLFGFDGKDAIHRVFTRAYARMRIGLSSCFLLVSERR